MARNAYTCAYCNSPVQKEFAVEYNTKHYHPECLQLFQERRELYETITRIFHLKAPGPANLKLVSKYFEDGYTYIGMKNTLIYIYDIKHYDVNKAEARIGLIPFMYEEAKEYFKNNRKMIEEVGAKAEMFERTKETNKVTIQKVPERQFLKEIKIVNTLEPKGGIHG